MAKTRQDASYTEPSTPSAPIYVSFDLDDPPADTSKGVRIWYRIDARNTANSSLPMQDKFIVLQVIHDFYPDAWRYFEPIVFMPGALPGDAGMYEGSFVIDNFINQYLRVEVLSPYTDDANPISVNIVAYQVD